MPQAHDIRAATAVVPAAAGGRTRRRIGVFRLDRLANGVFLLLPVFWAFGYLFPPLNHDVALVLDVAARWIDGERLYVDVIDVNPPLIFVLSALPAWLSRATDLPATTLFVLLVLMTSALSALLANRLLREAPLGSISRLLWPPLILFLLIVHPGENFGQREHLFLIAGLPYLLLAAAAVAHRRVGAPLEIGSALFAGFGLALKPYFLLPALLIEGWLLFSVRRSPFNLRTLSLLVGPVAHALIMALLTPAYVAEVVPLAFAYYAEHEDAVWTFALSRTMVPMIVAWCLFASLAFGTRDAPHLRVLVLFAFGGIVSAVLQAKGWSYQSLPASAGTVLLVLCCAGFWLERRLSPSRLPTAGPLFVVAAMALLYGNILLTGTPFRLQREYHESTVARLVQVMRAESYDGRVMILSPGVYPIFPAVNYAQVRPVMREDSLWLLQGLYADCRRGQPRYTPPNWMSPTEHKLFSALVRALVDIRPSLLVVDSEPGIPVCGGKVFDFLAYLGQDDRFAAALEEYELVTTFDRYSIYRRALE